MFSFKKPVAVMQEMHEMVPPMIPASSVSRTAVEVEEHQPVAVIAPIRVPIPDATQAPEAELTDTLRAQYAALVTELGIDQPGLLKDAARAFFRDRGTRLYDGAKVSAYLDDQYGPAVQRKDPRGIKVHSSDGSSRVYMRGYPTWGWRPLRAADRAALSSEQATFGYSTAQSNNAVWVHGEPYNKPIPLAVLLTAKEVLVAFPSAKLYISDEIHSHEHRDPVLDPFLLVVIEGERFIIERWDEPGYRE